MALTGRKMSGGFRALIASLALGLGANAAQAAPNAVSFGGNTLQQLRSGSEGLDRFTEYGRRDPNLSETLMVRSLEDRVPFRTKMERLVASIRKDNPQVKLDVRGRAGRDDVVFVYLADHKGPKTSMVMWRVAAVGDRVVAATYQIDFEDGNAAARKRVDSQAAARSLVKFTPADFARLVAAEK